MKVKFQRRDVSGVAGSVLGIFAMAVASFLRKIASKSIKTEKIRS